MGRKIKKLCSLTAAGILAMSSVSFAGTPSVEVDGKKLDTDPVIVDDRLYVPLRDLSEAMGLSVSWDENTKTAHVNSDKNAASQTENPTGKDSTEGFAYRLNELMPEDRNYMFSPLSIKLALALAANGAQGKTQEEILSVLGIEDINKFNADVKKLIADYSSENSAQLKISDSIWLNTSNAGGTKFNKVYSDSMKNFYNAELGLVTNNDAVEKINKWCSDSTNGKIKDIIDSPDFAAALVNAIYFKADWQEQFKERATAKKTFTDRNGKKTDIDFMYQQDNFSYYEDDDVKAIKLPYERRASMYIVLNGDKPVKNISDISENMKSRTVKVSIPKFRIEYSEDLKDMLAALGITKAFSNSEADFGTMFEKNVSDAGFVIGKVLHKTYIDVDENGTEAAAVTGIVMETTAVRPDDEPEEFVADKPFTFFITDNETNEILFMGEYAYAN